MQKYLLSVSPAFLFGQWKCEKMTPMSLRKERNDDDDDNDDDGDNDDAV